MAVAIGGVRHATRWISSIAAVTGFALAAASIAAGQQAQPGVYTAAQASAGRTAYQQNCASCHLPDLRGSNEAPPLAGSNFVATWRARTTADLFTRIRTTMPANNPGSLGDQDAINIVAFMLESNGATPGPQPLTPGSSSLIGDIAKGTPAPGAQAPAGNEAPGAPRARAAGAPAGMVVEGEVKNYLPVTDDMLLHPDPGDWLMIRGNYQAWNHSSLTQITKNNVGESAPGLGVVDERGRRQRAHTAGTQRNHLSSRIPTTWCRHSMAARAI